MSARRLVATDLDGTIVASDGSVSPRTVAALAAVEEAGWHLVLVTGRPPRWMAPVVEATGHRGSRDLRERRASSTTCTPSRCSTPTCSRSTRRPRSCGGSGG